MIKRNRYFYDNDISKNQQQCQKNANNYEDELQ